MVEVWLSDTNNIIRLPVLPEKITMDTGGVHEKVTLQEIGEALLIGKRKLRGMSIACFFPKRYSSFCQYRNIPDPAAASGVCTEWAEAGTVLRLVITGGAVAVNMQAVMESYAPTMAKAEGDIEYAMTLTEYRPLTATKVTGTDMTVRPREVPALPPPPPVRTYYKPPATKPPLIIKQAFKSVGTVMNKYPAARTNQTQ